MNAFALVVHLAIGQAAASEARGWSAFTVVERPTDTGGHPVRSPTDAEAQGLGCLVVGVVTTASAYAAGPRELMAVLAGGTVMAVSPAVVVVAVFGTAFAAGCAVGALGTPAVLWLSTQSEHLIGRLGAAVSSR